LRSSELSLPDLRIQICSLGRFHNGVGACQHRFGSSDALLRLKESRLRFAHLLYRGSMGGHGHLIAGACMIQRLAGDFFLRCEVLVPVQVDFFPPQRSGRLFQSRLGAGNTSLCRDNLRLLSSN
jgi:hypothetical protein